MLNYKHKNSCCFKYVHMLFYTLTGRTSNNSISDSTTAPPSALPIHTLQGTEPQITPDGQANTLHGSLLPVVCACVCLCV